MIALCYVWHLIDIVYNIIWEKRPSSWWHTGESCSVIALCYIWQGEVPEGALNNTYALHDSLQITKIKLSKDGETRLQSCPSLLEVIVEAVCTLSSFLSSFLLSISSFLTSSNHALILHSFFLLSFYFFFLPSFSSILFFFSFFCPPSFLACLLFPSFPFSFPSLNFSLCLSSSFLSYSLLDLIYYCSCIHCYFPFRQQATFISMEASLLDLR